MISRRQFVASTATSLALPHLALSATTDDFNFATVIEHAAARADAPYDATSGSVSDAWKALSYDQYRKIRFRRAATLWKNASLFQMQLFHAGFYFDRAVSINIVDNQKITPLAYDAALFDFDDLSSDLSNEPAPGYAGFRLLYPLNKGTHHDEFAVFLGASYFRLIGRQQVYGLSARGLAVNTALPQGEEFPRFREFWINQPKPGDTTIELFALLDSPSVSGAYRFLLRPRTAAQADVQAVLFARKDIEKLGIAPLTSMFLYGESGTRQFDDFRPEVHDSDGLMLHTSAGEWIWRPLENRQRLQVSSFSGSDPRGFGLVQRDRQFDHYQDLETRYDRRPSHWVQPLGEWGSGRTELIEIPSDEETNDNIVSYWVSDQPLRAGQRREYRYLLNAYLDQPAWPPGGKVVATRQGTSRRPGAAKTNSAPGRLFIIDFNAGDLPVLDADQPLEAIVTVGAGNASQPVVQKNVATGGWRVFFDYTPDPSNAGADLRCYLKLHQFVLTETWNYLWTP